MSGGENISARLYPSFPDKSMTMRSATKVPKADGHHQCGFIISLVLLKAARQLKLGLAS
jgi:hypothetical protein